MGMDIFFNGYFQSFSFFTGGLFVVLMIWSFIWKGAALWRAAKNEDKYWFIAILVLNTAGILEIVYLFMFSKKKLKVNEIIPGLKSFFQR